MVIKEPINILDDNLTRGIAPLVKIMFLVDQSKDDTIILDCSSIRFVSPVFVIALMLHLSSCSKKVSVTNIPTYLKTIGFCDAVKPEELEDISFEEFLKNYQNKTYILSFRR